MRARFALLFKPRKRSHSLRTPSFFSPSKASMITPESQNKVRPLRQFHSIVFCEKPMPSETRGEFTSRVHKNITTTLSHSSYASHLLFMSYPTRTARKNETLINASKQFGIKKMVDVNFGFVEKPILSGHCLLAFVDAKRKMTNEYTFSLRPNMQEKSFYTAFTAPDQRLPSCVTKEGIHVRPALHTTVHQEISSWANDAFYTGYVHHERPIYPLHFILKRLDTIEQNRYFAAVKDLKDQCLQYSLLDHFHRYTGETLGDIVPSQNCTILFRLFETLSSFSLDLKKILGDNPTPQLVRKTVSSLYFQCKTDEISKDKELVEIGEDELSKPFKRSTI